MGKTNLGGILVIWGCMCMLLLLLLLVLLLLLGGVLSGVGPLSPDELVEVGGRSEALEVGVPEELPLRFFWCRRRSSRPSSSHHTDSIAATSKRQAPY
jgi:hypothetical protein